MYPNYPTYFSFRYGIVKIRMLISEAIFHGIGILTPDKVNNISNCPEFIRRCETHNIKPIAGTNLRNGAGKKIVGIAQSQESFRKSTSLLTIHPADRTINHYPKQAKPS